MANVLVAGATGYLGSHVVRELVRRGHRVRALTRSTGRLDTLGVPCDVVQAEVTRPETLANVCDGIDIVFSSLGITGQRDGLTWRDVDYQGNLNLLQAAQHCGVEKFVYVSVFGGAGLRHLDIVDAHEAFVDVLRQGSMAWQVLRPTGYFSDLEAFLDMARRGRVYLFGDGSRRINPIHGADLAVVCGDAVEGRRTDREIDVGGPRVFTWRQIAELALTTCERPVRITPLPMVLVRGAATACGWFSRHRAELLRFFATSATTSMEAPPYGTHDLAAFFRDRRAER